MKSEDKQKRVIAAEELVLYQEHLQAPHLQRLVPEFRDLLLKDLEESTDAQLCATAASFFAPLAELEQPSVEHPPEENEAGLEARPEGGWVAALLEWGAVPALVTLLNWPSQSDTSPWPGAYAAAAGRLLCALAADHNAAAQERMLACEALLPGLLHALDEAWLNTCSAEILFYLCDSDRPGVLERIRRLEGAQTLVLYVSANVQNRRRRMRHYGPAAAENPMFYEVACLYFAVQVLILLAVRPDGEDDDESEETTKPGLPVPTAEILEAVQHVLGLKPPPRLAGAVQKLLNCCPEAQAAMQAQAEEQAHRSIPRPGWLMHTWSFLRKTLDDTGHSPPRKSQKVV